MGLHHGGSFRVPGTPPRISTYLQLKHYNTETQPSQHEWRFCRPTAARGCGYLAGEFSMSIAPRPDGSESAADESAGGTPTPPGPTIGRRRFVRGTVAVAGGLAAAGYVTPSLRALGV